MSYRRVDCGTWDEFLAAVLEASREFEQRYSESAVPFFRGHASSGYRLEPGLYRPLGPRYYADYDEQNFYYEFRARAGALLSPSFTSWDVLFLMQHHGVPTRLLDWTESFATALYFALQGADAEIDIWMLDPYALNAQAAGRPDILDVETHLAADYFEAFIQPGGRGKLPPGPALAIYPRRQIARLASQHGLFTLHLEDQYGRRPLEDLEEPWLTRIRLDGAALPEANRFLKVMGVNDFSMFPDLDGLSRYLRKRIRGGWGIMA
jgi:hypothetical protein